MIKKLATICLAIAITITGAVTTLSNQTVYAENVFGGYYEAMDNTGELEVGEALGAFNTATITGMGEITEITINLSTLPTVSGTKVILPDLGSDEEKLILGNVYTLTLKNGSGVVKAIDFMAVTKAISTKEDIKVIDLHDPAVEVTGYYVLTNNLVLEKGEENQFLGEDGQRIDLSWQTVGFNGTFDGRGYNIQFCADTPGFFGVIGSKSVIKNVGFVNVSFYTNGRCAVIAQSSEGHGGGLVDNVYIRTVSGQVPSGAVLTNGNHLVKIQNVVIDLPGSNVNVNDSDTLRIGALYGNNFVWWNTTIAQQYPGEQYASQIKYTTQLKNVYVIGRIPLMSYHGNTDYKGFYYQEDGKVRCEWMEGYASNEGYEEDLWAGIKVYEGTKKYTTGAQMKEDTTNDYSSFSSYWGVEEYGMPVWPNGIEDRYELFISSAGSKTMSVIYLQPGGVETAKIGFGYNEIPADGVTVNFEILKGSEFITIDSATGVITAVSEGQAQFNASCTFNGKTYSKKYTVNVKAPEVEDPAPETESSGGCGTVYITGAGIGGGGLMILSALAYMLIRRKKQTA